MAGPQWTPEQLAIINAEKIPAPVEIPAEISLPAEEINPLEDEWDCSRGAGCACAENSRGDCPFWRRAPSEAAA